MSIDSNISGERVSESPFILPLRGDVSVSLRVNGLQNLNIPLSGDSLTTASILRFIIPAP